MIRRRILSLALGVLTFGSGQGAGAQGRIVVGANVKVGAASPGWEHTEYIADAHPTDPKRVMVCSQRFSQAENQRTSVIYVTFDGGKTWAVSLADTGSKSLGAGDPVCTYGLNGEAYFVTIIFAPDTVQADSTPYGVYQWWRMGGDGNLHVYRSRDDGRTWGDTVRLPYLDAPAVMVDRTMSPYRGRVYISGNTSGRGLWLIFSSDSGRTWVRSERTDTTVQFPRSGTVLPTGTLVLPFHVLPHLSAIATSTSSDGGVHLSRPITVASLHGGTAVECTPISSLNMASDHSTGPFRGRAYIVWADLYRGRCTTHVSHSDDEGKTWSVPSRVGGDERPRAMTETQGRNGPPMPQIAVNLGGIVGITWYEWDDWATDTVARRTRLRFAASLDGGDDWLPSVAVSEHGFVTKHPPAFPAQTFTEGGGRRRSTHRTDAIDVLAQPAYLTYYPWNYFPGDYTGIAVGADGAFHGFWIDNRSGDGDLYTAGVTVDGVVAKADADVAPLANITSRVEVQFTSSIWDPRTKTLSWAYRLMNTTTDTILGPLKLRIVQLSSDLGVPTLVLDGGRGGGAGTIIDLSHALAGGCLPPGQVTPPQRLQVRLTEVHGALGPRARDLVHMRVKVYGIVARADSSRNRRSRSEQERRGF